MKTAIQTNLFGNSFIEKTKAEQLGLWDLRPVDTGFADCAEVREIKAAWKRAGAVMAETPGIFGDTECPSPKPNGN